MQDDKLYRLKEVLQVHTHFGEEERMKDYLIETLTSKGYSFEVEKVIGDWKSVHYNIYVTKGEAEVYPCMVSHIDTVHRIDENMVVTETIEGGEKVLTGINKETKQPSGIGGDDKCGVFLCLEMLDKLDVVKVAFFGGEERGMQGSKRLNEEFFKDAGYAIQFDSPEGNTMSLSLCNENLFNVGTPFGDVVSDRLYEYGVDQWRHHPYTDVYQILSKTSLPCLNLPAGYYRYHTASEYVKVSDVQNVLELASVLVEELGNKKYIRKEATTE